MKNRFSLAGVRNVVLPRGLIMWLNFTLLSVASVLLLSLPWSPF